MSTHIFTTVTPCPLYDPRLEAPALHQLRTISDVVHDATATHCTGIRGAAAAVIDPTCIDTVYTDNNAITLDEQRNIAAAVFAAIRQVRRVCAEYSAGFPANWTSHEMRAWIRRRLNPTRVAAMLTSTDTSHADLAEHAAWICDDTRVYDCLPIINDDSAAANNAAVVALRELFVGWDETDYSAPTPEKPIIYVWKGASRQLLEVENYTVVVIDPNTLCDIIADYLSSIDYDLRYDVNVMRDLSERRYWITGGLSTGDAPTDAMDYLDVANTFQVFE